MASGATSVHRRRQLRLAPALVSGAAVLVVAVAAPASAVSGSNSVSVGLPPTAVVIDHATHTAYVAVSDGVASQVVIVNAARCTAVPSPHCAGAVTAVTLPGNPGAAGLAFDAKNHTVYVTDANTGNVSMINATTCNATRTGGCASAPKVALLGLTAPGAIAVDATHHRDAVYVADAGGHTVTAFNGATCNAAKTSGCKSVRKVSVGSAPSAIAIDAAVGTVYVANRADDNVSTLDASACGALKPACTTRGKTVSLGTGATPSALVADPVAKTLYVADSGTGAVSFLNTATCHIHHASGCAKTPPAQSGVADPEGLALVSADRIAVADAGAGAVIVFRAADCNATKRTGCTAVEVNLLSGSPVAVAVRGATVYAADTTTSTLDAVAVPTLTATVSSKHAKTRFGWYRSPITVRFACHAGTSPLKSKCPPAVKVTKDGRRHLVVGTVTSADGGRATVRLVLKLDRTKPTVQVKGVTNGATYSTAPTLRCKAHDALSGVASCRITRSHHGQRVDYVATAEDRAGNVARTHGSYRVS
jgi:hypothetical protein